MAQDEIPDEENTPDPEAVGAAGEESTADAEEPAASSRGPRTALLIVGGVVGVIVVAYLVMVLSTAGGVPRATTVAGVDIGGLSQEEAAQRLETELADLVAAPITIVALDQEGSIVPADVGLAPDFAATAELASGPIFAPARLLRHVTGQSVEVAPVVSYNAVDLGEQIEAFALAADLPAVEPSIEMSVESPSLTPGEDGKGVDQEAAPSAISGAYLFTEGPVELPTSTLTPTVGDDEAGRVLDEFAVPAVSGPVALTYDSTSEDLSVAAIAAALSFAPEDGTLQPQLNVEVVRASLPRLAEVEKPGKDATWNVSSGRPVVVPSAQGTGVTDENLTSGILGVLPETDPSLRKASLTITETDPDLTTAAAQALNINEQLSTFTQKFDYAEYRLINVGQAAEYMNGKVLKPGDVYSMNDTIKERTKANGYVSGTFISGGRFAEGLGGGVSIATTATWTSAFFAGLEAVEVNPHSLFISRYQPGLEATVAWGALDLKFRNNTGNGVLITTESSGTFITVTMWGTRLYSKIDDVSSDKYAIQQFPTKNDTSAGCKNQGGVIGFTIDVYRVFYKGTAEVEREKFTTRYDPTTRVVCAPAPRPPAPSPSPTAAGDAGSTG